MRQALVLVVTLLLLSPPAGGAVPDGFRRAIVVLGLLNPEARRYIRVGTAFHAGNGFFYTNAHVVLAKERLQREEGVGYSQWIVVAPDEFGNPIILLGTAETHCVDKRYKASPFGDPEPYDVATVRFAGPESRLSPPLRLSPARVTPGERVRALGYPHGTVLFEMRGTVTEVDAERIVVRRDTGTTTLPGSSGSPLLNARDEVSGIHQGSNVGHMLTQAVPIQAALSGCPIP